jgi:nucleoside-diphosphate-sugar epimerase
MNILITGANGFLGSTIVRQALVSQISLRATDLHESPVISGIDYDPSDITNPSTFKPLLKGITGVIHTAGLAHIFGGAQAQNAPFYSVNVIGTVNMINAAVLAGVQHFVLISSVSVYGPFTHGMYSEDNPCRPVGAYAKSKHRAELEAQEIARKSAMALTILRLATLYGEGDPGNVGRLMRALARGRFFWIGDGSNRKSLLYKGDAARACLVVADQPASGINIYNVSAPPCTMHNIVDGLAMALGKKPLPVRIPASIAISAGNFLSCFPEKRLSRLHSTIEKWLGEDVYDTSRIESDYGFHAQVELIEGLKREVRWYRQSQGKIFQ